MIRVRDAMLWGLLAGATGCASLRQPRAVSAPLPPAGVAVARNGDAAARADGPVDPFHAQGTASSARLSRFFPLLTRAGATPPSTATPAATEATPARRIGLGLRPKATPGGPDAPARPDSEPADAEASTAALPARRPWGRTPTRKADAPVAPRADPAARVASAGGDAPRRADAPPPPLLEAALVAEVDHAEPASKPAPAAVADRSPAPAPAPGPRADRGELFASTMPLSTRRMPPLPELSPEPGRRPPRRGDLASRDDRTADAPPGAREADDQARRARAEGDLSDAPGPILAVEPARAEPPADRPEPIADAPSADRPEPIAEAPAAESPHAEAATPKVDDRPAEAASPKQDAPAPIDPPRAASRPEPPADDPDAAGDPTLRGRPRLARPSGPRREALPPDVPPPAFPRTYYGETAPKSRVNPLIDDAADAPRRAWTPRLWKRLRGE